MGVWERNQRAAPSGCVCQWRTESGQKRFKRLSSGMRSFAIVARLFSLRASLPSRANTPKSLARNAFKLGREVFCYRRKAF